MKIFTATFYKRNFGSALQAFALQRKLKELGCDAVVIDPETTLKRNPSSLTSRVAQFLKPERHYGFGDKVRRKLQKIKMKVKYTKIDNFLSQNVSTESFDDCESEIQNSKCILLAGSDQIWSIINHPIGDLYLFKFAPKHVRKFSYAASIGLSKLSEADCEYYKEALADFESVSFREKVAYDLLRDSISNPVVRKDIDPTLLFDGEFWSNVACERLYEKPYIFVYMLRPDKKIIKMARDLAKRTGLRIVYMGLYINHYCGVKTINDAGVEEYLSYIKNADFVITNSFHGTVFSVQFEKRFVSVKIESTSSRAENLLESLGLNAHLISSVSEVYVALTQIDYEAVNAKLNLKRKASIGYLMEIARIANG